MARIESDREDLMREATALVRRVEFHMPQEDEPIVAGFHRDGRVSIYFGGDPVYHLDAEAGLRRAFVDGDLFRTQGDTLARLTRQRTESESILARVDLNADQLEMFLHRAVARLQRLIHAAEVESIRVERSIPAESDVFGDALKLVRQFVENQRLAAPIRTKR